ncbi:MAG: hypothetical protein ABSF62_09655 [Bryobacteraceae bacterium]
MKNIQIPIALAAILCLPALCLAQTIPAYTITTIAGNNTAGYSGDAAAATAAEIDGPAAVWIDSKGNLYIADQFNNRIRMVSASNGNITTVAGDGTPGFLGDTGSSQVETAVNAEINGPDAVILDSKGNIYIADTTNNVVRMVTPAGAISTYAGDNALVPGPYGDGGQANVAALFGPAGLAMDSSGNLYISDNKNNRIRKVIGVGLTNAGIISTIVDGNGDVGFNGDGGLATQAHINAPRAMAIDSSGALYFADSGSNMIRKVVPAAATGTITLVAGSTQDLPGFAGDGGQATSALLNDPTGVAVDTCGNVYIADSRNSRIRMVTTGGIINTIAGSTVAGTSEGYSGDGGPALSAQLNFPAGVAVDSKGNVYVADTQNAVIRLLTPASAPPCGGALPAVSTGGVISLSAFGANPSMAPGSWIEIYGSNLAADSRQWTTADFSNNDTTAPTTLDRTSVTINGQSAFIDYISPGQVDALVPANTGTGPLQLTVSTAAGTSSAVTVTVNTVQPGLWAPAQFIVGGKQYVGATHADGTFVAPPGVLPSGYTSSYAKPGEIITFWGIGFGVVGPGVSPGQVAPAYTTLALPIQFNFGGIGAAVPAYYGLAPGSVGLYQFNVVVPSVANNDFVPLTFTLGSGNNAVTSNQTLYTAVHN